MITKYLSDDAFLSKLGERLCRYRLRLGLTQAALADKAGISKRTVERIEAGSSAQLSSFIRLCRALDLLDDLDRLVPALALSPMEQLKLGGKQRRRASSQPPRPPTSAWVWGDS